MAMNPTADYNKFQKIHGNPKFHFINIRVTPANNPFTERQFYNFTTDLFKT